MPESNEYIYEIIIIISMLLHTMLYQPIDLVLQFFDVSEIRRFSDIEGRPNALADRSRWVVHFLLDYLNSWTLFFVDTTYAIENAFQS